MSVIVPEMRSDRHFQYFLESVVSQIGSLEESQLLGHLPERKGASVFHLPPHPGRYSSGHQALILRQRTSQPVLDRGQVREVKMEIFDLAGCCTGR